MVAVAGFATGAWVDVTAVVVGSVGKVGFMGKVGLAGIGCTIILILNLLFTGTLALFSFLGTGAFCGEEFLSGEKVLVHGCGWGWAPSLPSSSK